MCPQVYSVGCTRLEPIETGRVRTVEPQHPDEREAMRLLKRYPAASFWVIAYAIAWGIGFTAGVDPEVLAADYSEPVAYLLDRSPKFAFTIAALVVVLVGGVDRAGFWKRLTRWRVGVGWYALAILAPLAAYGISAYLAPGSKSFDFSNGWVSAALIGADTGLITYLLTRAGLGEEPGLRGFVLHRHEERMSRRRAAFLVGVLWGAWHLPVLIDRDLLSVVAFLSSVLALSYVFSWVFHASGGSVLIVALLHAGINAFDDLWELTVPALATVDWEIPFFAITYLAGVAAAIVLREPAEDEVLV